MKQEKLHKSKRSLLNVKNIEFPTCVANTPLLLLLLKIREGGGKMIRTLFSSSACCPLVRMAPTRSLSLLTSLQQDPYSLVLFGTTMRPWMMELPSLLRASIGTSALCRSDEEKGPMIDNAAMSRQLHASKVNMKKAGEELVKKAAVIRRKKSGTPMHCAQVGPL